MSDVIFAMKYLSFAFQKKKKKAGLMNGNGPKNRETSTGLVRGPRSVRNAHRVL